MKTLIKITIAVLFLIGMSINAQAQYAITVVSGNNQVGVVNGMIRDRVRLLATHNGRPVAFAEVRYASVLGGGRPFIGSSRTNEIGHAEVSLELGSDAGENTFSATVFFTATITATTTITAKALVNVLDLHTGGSGNSNLWEKYIGQRNDANIPDIPDFSYAGFGNSDESIPKVHNYPIYNVMSYGAIPNDGLSDSRAIRSAINAARGGNSVVLFPPGHYDIFMNGDGDSRQDIWVGTYNRVTNNLIIKGSGAKGSKHGGTTIQMHNSLTRGNQLFRTIYIQGSGSASSPIVGSFPRGTKYFDVENGNAFSGKRYVKLRGDNLTGSDWADHSSKTKAQMISDWGAIGTDPNKNISVNELHEIDRIEGNRIYIVKATLTPINANYRVYSVQIHTGMGFEDLHIDCGFTRRYSHLDFDQNGGIILSQTANSWIKRCRITNTTHAVRLADSYGASVMGIIIDGNSGHYPVTVYKSSFTLVAMIEDFATPVIHHGMSVASNAAGTVIWYVNIKRGPDAHGGQPRHTLFDNYYSENFMSNGGTLSNFPNHIDIYLRWNNHVSGNVNASLYSRWSGMTSSATIGLVTEGGAGVRNSYVESYGSRVSIDSLYEAQLEHRLGYIPLWLQDAKQEYRQFFNDVYNRRTSLNPIFHESIPVRRSIAENTVPGINVGRPVSAYFSGGLTYHIEESDGDYFDIDANTGQITVKGVLDFEKKSTHTGRVIARGSNGAADSIRYVISITDEEPEMMPVADRTPQVRDAIYSHFRDDLRPITKEHISNFPSLNIANKGLTSLKSGDFDGLGSITSLALSDNSLESLPDDIFEGLDNLRDLQLHNNNIASLPEGVFDGLTELFKITMDHNKLTALPDNLFADLSLLDWVEFSHNKITRIQKDLFAGAIYLSYISLHNNEIVTIDPLMFNQEMRDSVKLYLNNNRIEALPESNLFSNFRNLKVFNLSNNTGTPFNVPVKLVSNPDNLMEYRAIFSQHAPFTMKIKIDVENGHTVAEGGGARTQYITINAGETASSIVEVVPDVNPQGDVTIDMTLPILPTGHKGYVLQKVNNYSLVQSVGRP